MDFVGLQVPVPQPQFAGLQCQRQARLTLAQRLIGRIKFQTTLGDTAFQIDLDFAQFVFGTPTLIDFPGQLLIELVAAVLRLLQILDQRLILETSQQAAIDQPIDLPGDHTQRTQQNQAEPAPTVFVPTPEHIGNGRQQAGQGEGQERRQTHRVGHAGRKRRGTDQAEDPRLLNEVIGGNQRNAGTGQGQASETGAQ